MPKRYPIESDLFHFISTRPTQTLNPQLKPIFYITAPNIEQEYKKFIENTKNTPPDEIQNTFNTRHRNIYQFGLRLLSQKERTNINELYAQAKKLNPINEKPLSKIWGFLFNSLLNNNPNIAQSCTTLLIANHFIDTVTNEKKLHRLTTSYSEEIAQRDKPKQFELFLRRLANSKITLPKPLLDDLRALNANRPRPDSPTTDKDPKPNKSPTLLPDEAMQSRLRHANTCARSLTYLSWLTEIKNELKTLLAENRERSISHLLDDENIGLSKKARLFLTHYPQKNHRLIRVIRNLNNKIIEANQTYRQTKQALNQLPSPNNLPETLLVNISFAQERWWLTATWHAPSRSLTAVNLHLTHNGEEEHIRQLKQLRESSCPLTTQVIQSGWIDTNTLKESFYLEGILNWSDGTRSSLNIELSIDSPNHFLDLEAPFSQGHQIPPSPTTHSRSTVKRRKLPINIGIGVLRTVRQTLCCYLPGEIAHIENIMAREYKERSTRSLFSTRYQTDTTITNTSEIQRDTETTTRKELQKEIANVLEKRRQIGFGVNLGAKWAMLGVEIEAQAGFNYDHSTATSTSDREAYSFAVEVTQAATQKIATKIESSRRWTEQSEFEDKTTHGYDNRAGDNHVTAIYRWLDILYNYELIDNKKIAIVEIVIPEPARYLKAQLKPTPTDNIPNDSAPPLPPLENFGILGPDDIEAYDTSSPAHYSNLASQYSVTIDPPPPLEITKHLVLSKTLDGKSPDTQTRTVALDDGYHLRSAKLDGYFIFNSKRDETRFEIFIAGKTWSPTLHTVENDRNAVYEISRNITINRDGDRPSRPNPNPRPNKNIIGSTEVSVSVNRIATYSTQIELNQRITEQRLLEWKNQVFERLALQIERHSKDGAPSSQSTPPDEESLFSKIRHPQQVEIQELKRSAMEFLVLPSELNLGQNSYHRSARCDTLKPALRRNLRGKGFKAYADLAGFLEEVLDWDNMSYRYYPYYWSDRCSWSNAVNQGYSDDLQFEQFINSGMARIWVPIRPGHESIFSYYLETGTVPPCENLLFDTNDDLYLSLDEELLKPNGCLDQQWQTRVPTTLTLIQKDSAALTDQSLPCCSQIPEDYTTGIINSTEKLGNLPKEK